jgi:iron complex transport system ATP-binding protein
MIVESGMPPGSAPYVDGKDHAPVGDSWAGALLEVRRVGVRKGGARLLGEVHLVAEPRWWTAIVGPNGAGKTTLLRCIAGLQRHEGAVLVDGRAVTSLSPRERAREIGYAPQVPVLPEAVTVAEYVLLGRTPYRPLLIGPRREDRQVVEGALERLDLTSLASRTLRTLSGGERQRAVLARALAQQPRLLLLDEPTAALDLGHAQSVLETVDELRREQGLTVVTTLHDLVLAGQYAESLVLLAGGRVAAAGRPRDVLTREALATYYGATADVTADATGVRVHPVRPTLLREPG